MPVRPASLDRFGPLSSLWNLLSTHQRIQVMDDAAAYFKSQPAHVELASRIETQLALAVQRNEPIDTSLHAQIAQALAPAPQLALFPEISERSPDITWQRYRLITRPLESVDTSYSSPMMIRGPAGTLRPAMPGHDLMEEFGKVVVRLWNDDRQSARRHLASWSATRNAPEGAMETQSFADTPENAQHFIDALVKSGFDVRHAVIPDSVRRKDGAAEDGGKTCHWIVGRHLKQPIARWFSEFVDNRSRAPVKRLDLMDREDVDLQNPGTPALMHSLFGRPVSVEDIHRGFAVDVPGYVTSRVHIRRNGEAGVFLLSEITFKKTNEIASRLSGWLPDPPPAGEPWIAWGEDLNEELYKTQTSERMIQHFQRGIGRRSMVKVLAFLYRHGVNGLDMKGRGKGLSFMIHIGFDFQNPAVREQVLADFREYLQKKGILLSSKSEMDLLHVRHAWELLDFQNDRGEPLGRKFFEDYAGTRQVQLPLRFWLRPDYPGWPRLFSRQLNAAQDAKPGNEDQQQNLREEWKRKQVAEVLQEAVFFDPNAPEEQRRANAARAEIILQQEGELEAARHDAQHDGLTGLLTRRAFLAHNEELEKSLSHRRHPDSDKPHGVAIIDIDFFKKVNDKHGHLAGDAAIRHVCQILKENAREDDLVGRYGGEEFVAVFRHAGIEGLKKKAEDIRKAVESRRVQLPNGEWISLTVSIGITLFQKSQPQRRTPGENNPFEEREEPNSLLESVDRADKGLYQAKQAGRNRVFLNLPAPEE